jgi:Putative transposase
MIEWTRGPSRPAVRPGDAGREATGRTAAPSSGGDESPARRGAGPHHLGLRAECERPGGRPADRGGRTSRPGATRSRRRSRCSRAPWPPPCRGRSRSAARRAAGTPPALCGRCDCHGAALGPAGEGFSLHADVAVPARRRDHLAMVCRYILRPPLTLERLTESTGGQLLYLFRRPIWDSLASL